MVETEPFDDSLFDTLIVGGSTEQSFSPSEGLLTYLRKAPEISRRLAATCVGAFTLAEAVFSMETGDDALGLRARTSETFIRR